MPGRASQSSDAVTDYARRVVSGDVLAGRLVRLSCERHLRDLDEGVKRGLAWDPEEAARRISVFSHLRQSKGRWAGEPLELLDWQRFVVGSAFGWYREDGTRRFRRVYVEVARKNGKTTLVAGVALNLLDFDGEAGSEVYAAATKRDQARLCWGEAARMVRQTPSLRRRIRIIDSRANMHILDTSSKFEALGADSDSLDGLNPHGVIIDELHAHRDRRVVDVLETAMGARVQPQIWYVTTAGLEGESIYTETHDYARRVVEGTVEDDQWLVYIATLDEGDDWTNPDVYIKANPSLGVTVQLDELIQERDRAMAVPGRQNAFRRLRLNQRVQQAQRWLDVREWDACADESLGPEAFRGRTVYAGLDLASTRDVTAMVMLARSDEPGYDYDLWEHYWVPEEGIGRRSREDGVPYDVWRDQGHLEATSGNITDYDVIRERIQEYADDYGIGFAEVAYDRWNANQLVTQLGGDGLTCIPFGQGFASMAAPSRMLEALIAGKRIRHAGNPVTRWMVGNVTTEQDAAGNLKPSKARSAEKIDGVVALLMALGRAMVNGGDSGGRSIYEDRGLLSL